VIWVLVEARSSNPLIDMRMMAIRSVWAVNLVALLFGVAMYALFAFLPEFLQTPKAAGYGFGASITLSGVMILPMSVFMFLVGLVTGRLAQRFGSKWVLIAGSAIGAAALVMLTVAHDQEWQIYVSMAITGIGFGLAFSSMSNIIVAAVRREQTGVASGMNANIRTIGGSLGAAIMGSIVTARVTSTGLPVESGYSNGFLLLAAALLLSAIAALLIPSIAKHAVGHHREEPVVEMRHAELGLVAGGTLVGDESE
jgi:predicted MFS family arabinose efflux permease